MYDPNAWKRKPRLDFLEKEIKEGDIIVCLNPYYRDLMKAKVIKITPKKITIQLDGYNPEDKGKYNGNKTTRYSDQVIKI